MEMKAIRNILLLGLMIFLSACGNVSVDDQVSTLIAGTAIAQTAIARGIASTMSAQPTATSTVTDTPTLANTPTETPTVTLPPTETWTPGPTLPPIFVTFLKYCSDGNGYWFIFDIMNTSNTTLRLWDVKMEDESGNKTTYGQGTYQTRTCTSLGNDSFLNPGSSSNVFVKWWNEPAGHTFQIQVRAYEWGDFKNPYYYVFSITP